jgi:tRNA 2-selenouridine synthase
MMAAWRAKARLAARHQASLPRLPEARATRRGLVSSLATLRVATVAHDALDSARLREATRLVRGETPVLDVRSEMEWLRGHAPLSSNSPILSDIERHLVGARYKEEGEAAAVSLGAALVSGELREQRVAAWVAWHRANPGGVLTCFRGGLRSRTAQQWVAAACGGEAPARLEGGYRQLRRELLRGLGFVAGNALLVVAGQTGAGKTALLEAVARRGASVLDLEALAHHRGSVFGAMASPQPAQATFENAVCTRLWQWRTDEPSAPRPLVVEGECESIGDVRVPSPLHAAMREAPVVLLRAPLEERVERILHDYVLEGPLDSERADEALCRVQRRLGMLRFGRLRALIADAFARHRAGGGVDGHRDWIAAMLREYYDRRYAVSETRDRGRVVFEGSFGDVAEFILAQRLRAFPVAQRTVGGDADFAGAAH